MSTSPCGCTDHGGAPKLAYRSKLTALSVAASAVKKRGGTLTAYRCPTSTGWHLTSKPQRTRRTP